MRKSIQSHLDSITAESFQNWTYDCFNAYCSHSGRNGNISIGVNGRGMFLVKERMNSHSGTAVYPFVEMQDAIDKYKELVEANN